MQKSKFKIFTQHIQGSNLKLHLLKAFDPYFRYFTTQPINGLLRHASVGELRVISAFLKEAPFGLKTRPAYASPTRYWAASKPQSQPYSKAA
jgi:hypothetical protein